MYTKIKNRWLLRAIFLLACPCCVLMEILHISVLLWNWIQSGGDRLSYRFERIPLIWNECVFLLDKIRFSTKSTKIHIFTHTHYTWDNTHIQTTSQSKRCFGFGGNCRVMDPSLFISYTFFKLSHIWMLENSLEP